MNWIYSPVINKKTPTSFVAVVDGLPPPEAFEDWALEGDRPFTPAEGIAIGIMHHLAFSPLLAKDGNHPPVLEFKSGYSDLGKWAYKKTKSDEKDLVSTLTIPVANTLFINGRQSTAFTTRWRVPEDGQSLVPDDEGSSAVKTIRIGIPRPPRKAFDHHVPLHALTMPRKVISSMGNVIRELEGDDGKVLRASTELEEVVPKFLQYRRSAEIKVFAAVMPPGADFESPAAPTFDKVLAETPSGEPVFHKRREYSITYDVLWNKGHFYRVTSGGGGWGKKAGLLSLDPAKNFEPLDQSGSSLFPDPDDMSSNFDNAADFGALVPCGHTIQFFAAQVKEPYSPYYTTQPNNASLTPPAALLPAEEWSNLSNQKILVGTGLPKEARQPDMPSAEARLAPITVLPDCFGALSEGGVSLALVTQARVIRKNQKGDPRVSVGQHTPVHQFRIDAPYASFSSLLQKKPEKDKEDALGSISQTSASTPGGADVPLSRRELNKTMYETPFHGRPFINLTELEARAAKEPGYSGRLFRRKQIERRLGNKAFPWRTKTGDVRIQYYTV